MKLEGKGLHLLSAGEFPCEHYYREVSVHAARQVVEEQYKRVDVLYRYYFIGVRLDVCV